MVVQCAGWSQRHPPLSVSPSPCCRAVKVSASIQVSSGVSALQRPSQPETLPIQSHLLHGAKSSRSCGRHRSVRMHSSRSHQSITISSLQEPFQCNVLQPASVSETQTALILLSDIFGCSTEDTLNVSQVRCLRMRLYFSYKAESEENTLEKNRRIA